MVKLELKLTKGGVQCFESYRGHVGKEQNLMM